MIRGIYCVRIGSPDPENLGAFYRDAFGFRPFGESRGAWHERVAGVHPDSPYRCLLKAPNLSIEIYQSAALPAGEGSGIPALCFDVVNLHAVHQRLVDNGVPFLQTPADLGFAWSVSGRDPDGNSFQLLELKNPFDDAQVFWSDAPAYA